MNIPRNNLLLYYVPFRRILLIRRLRVLASPDAKKNNKPFRQKLLSGCEHPYTQETGDERTSPVT